MPKLEKALPIELRLFAQNFKLAREKAGLSQKQVHEMTGLARSYLSDVERQIESVGIDTMALMAQAVEVPLYRLLDSPFAEQYDFTTRTEWQQYQRFIDNTGGSPYERKVFARNFWETRKAKGHLQKDILDATGIAKAFLIAVERAERSLSLDNALKLAQAIHSPLRDLLMPPELKTATPDSITPTPS